MPNERFLKVNEILSRDTKRSGSNDRELRRRQRVGDALTEALEDLNSGGVSVVPEELRLRLTQFARGPVPVSVQQALDGHLDEQQQEMAKRARERNKARSREPQGPGSSRSIR